MKKQYVALALLIPLAACSSVDSGEIGLWNHFGEINNETAGPGLHTYNWFTTSLETMDIKGTATNCEVAVYTSDLQSATVKCNIMTSLDPGAAVRMRKTIGLDWRPKIVPPVVEATIKDIFGQFKATEAIAKRPVMQQRMLELLRKRLAPRGISIEAFQVTNIQYSPEYEKAVEAAQTATQRAIEAQNATVRVREEATQRGIQAEAEANAIKVQAQAISANPQIVQLRAIEKWNGELPQNMYGSAPLPFVGH